MLGINAHTGQTLAGLDHLRQSIADILSTPLNTRVMRRDYGCLLPLLLDQPDNPATQIRITAAVAGALLRWEPRVRLMRLGLARDAERPGHAELQLRGQIVVEPLRRPLPLSLTIPLRGAA